MASGDDSLCAAGITPRPSLESVVADGGLAFDWSDNDNDDWSGWESWWCSGLARSAAKEPLLEPPGTVSTLTDRWGSGCAPDPSGGEREAENSEPERARGCEGSVHAVEGEGGPRVEGGVVAGDTSEEGDGDSPLDTHGGRSGSGEEEDLGSEESWQCDGTARKEGF